MHPERQEIYQATEGTDPEFTTQTGSRKVAASGYNCHKGEKATYLSPLPPPRQDYAYVVKRIVSGSWDGTVKIWDVSFFDY